MPTAQKRMMGIFVLFKPLRDHTTRGTIEPKWAK